MSKDKNKGLKGIWSTFGYILGFYFLRWMIYYETYDFLNPFGLQFILSTGIFTSLIAVCLIFSFFYSVFETRRYFNKNSAKDR